MAAAISITPNVVPNGTEVTIQFSGIPAPALNDWIAIYKSTGGVSQGSYLDWVYAGTLRQWAIAPAPGGAGTFVVILLITTTPGEHILKLHDGATSSTLASAVFTVNAGTIPDTVVQFPLGNPLPITLREHGACVFDGSMWVIGGLTTDLGPGASQRVYRSNADGSSWSQVGSDVLPRALHQLRAVVFHDKMWFFGGRDTTPATRDEVYSSIDGLTWTLEGHLPNPLADDYMAAVYKDKIYLIYYDSIYVSSDGISWVKSPIPWDPIKSIQGDTVIFNGELWVFGGYGTTNIYKTSDGVSWSVVGHAPVPQSLGRWGYSVTVYNGKLWMHGGYDTAWRDDVFSSDDGEIWAPSPFGSTSAGGDLSQAQTLHRAVVFDNRMWLQGGWVSFGSGTTANVHRATSYSLPSIIDTLDITGSAVKQINCVGQWDTVEPEM